MSRLDQEFAYYGLTLKQLAAQGAQEGAGEGRRGAVDQGG